MPFNPLDHPICLAWPDRTAESAWLQHTPFAMLLVDLLRPRLFVELGVHRGSSYCAFCQAVSALDMPCKCVGVDSWQGDEHAGVSGTEQYGSDVLAELQAYHDPRYGTFSTLMRSTFDEAASDFGDGSIDLLHIDGYHTYEAVRHDFETWAPKMSARGVVLLHDISERKDDFGVNQLWGELKARYPLHLELGHGHGLGVVVVGQEAPEGLQLLLSLSPAEFSGVAQLFADLGQRVEAQQLAAGLQHERARLATETERLQDERRIATRELEAERKRAALNREMERRSAAEAHAIERDELESKIEALQWQLSETQSQLETTRWQLAWLDQSRGVRLVKLARASRALLRKRGLLATSRQILLWGIGNRGFYKQEAAVRLPVREQTLQLTQSRVHKQVLFLSGCPGDAMRYRCEHQVEQLQLLGCSADFATYGKVDLIDLLDRYECFFLHRVPYGEDIEVFLARAKARGKPVIFETDDLVFDLDAIKHIAALEDLTPDERALYTDGVRRYRTTMLSCGAVTVSTEALREYAKPLRETVVVAPNVVSREMVRRADLALATAHARSAYDRPSVTIGYFSGTPTHNRDFAVAQEALLWALSSYPHVRFKLVGHLRLDSRFEQFGSRVERVPLQPWQRLPEIYTDVDISIAPLEPNNVFTESKSSIKYLEAALVKVPTIASPRTDFLRVVEPGVTGLLAETDAEWREAFRQLIESPELRQQLGENAFRAVRQNDTTLAHSAAEYELLRDLYRGLKPAQEGRKLRINWILRAPVASRGGGYRTIFRLANSLGGKGHTVRVYVEPIAHLEGMTDSQIRAYVAEHFGPLQAQVYVGHQHILPADATIATNWPTAFTAAEHDQSLFKFYFVQDYEPEFYEPGEHNYREAERTYSLSLQHISIGAYLRNRIEQVSHTQGQMVDFAIDSDVFKMTRRPEDREGPIRVLFFARPGLKRRGFELGVEALTQLKQRLPDVEIFTFGSTDDELGILPFAATNLGVLEPDQLAQELNNMHILLTFSLSNISWVPFEGMACGIAVVEANVPSVREMVAANETCLLADPEPTAVAEAVARLATDSALRVRLGTQAAEAMGARSWSETADQFERILLDQCW